MKRRLGNGLPVLVVLGAVGLMLLAGCPGAPTASTYTLANIVADTAAFPGARIDRNLLNAWGIILDPASNFLITSNHAGQALFYDASGVSAGAGMTIPPADTAGGAIGAPSGVVRNPSTDFKIPGTGVASAYLFSTEDGLIAAWAAGPTAAIIVAPLDSTAVYKGLTIAKDGANYFLYAANFKDRRIDVFDKDFTRVTTRPFADPDIPADYGPFNIQNIGDKLYVTYAKHKSPDNVDDQSGPGFGYVDVYNLNGTLDKRLATQGALNSPWGIAKAPGGFGEFAGAILVGNFGDGRINVYNEDGTYLGYLKYASGEAVEIKGIWGLCFKSDVLYFAAGPYDEAHGLFGSLTKD